MHGFQIGITKFFRQEWSGALLAVILLVIVFGINNPDFLGPSNLMLIVNNGAAIGLIAAGMTIVILMAGIDLSVGSLLLLCSAVTGYAASYLGLSPFGAAILGVSFGLAVGLFHGTLIAQVGMPPFIVTLGGLYAWRGWANFMTKAETSPPLPDAYNYMGSYNPLNVMREPVPSSIDVQIDGLGFWDLLREWLYGSVMDELTTGQIFEVFWISTWANFQMAFFIHIGFFIIISIMLSRMRIGRYIYAIGSSEKSASQSGINVKLYIVLGYVLCAFGTAMASVVTLGQVSTSSNLLGQGYELQAIAAVVIGGTSLFGGRGTIWGSFLGVILIKTIENGFLQTGFASNAQGTFLQMMLTGFIILIAVGIDILRTNKSLFRVQQFLIGIGTAFILSFALVGPGAQVWVGAIKLWEHNSMSSLKLKRDLQTAAVEIDGAEEDLINSLPPSRQAWAQAYFQSQLDFGAQLRLANERLQQADLEFAPFNTSFQDAKRLIRSAQNTYRRATRDGADESTLAELRREMNEAQEEAVEIYSEGAAQEVALTKAKREKQSLIARRVAINFQQEARILDAEQQNEARAQVSNNLLPALLLLAASSCLVVIAARPRNSTLLAFGSPCLGIALICLLNASGGATITILCGLAITAVAVLLPNADNQARKILV